MSSYCINWINLNNCFAYFHSYTWNIEFLKLSFLMLFWKSELCAPLWLLCLFSGPLLGYLWPFLGSENLLQCQLALITQKFFIKFRHFDVTQILIHSYSVMVLQNLNSLWSFFFYFFSDKLKKCKSSWIIWPFGEGVADCSHCEKPVKGRDRGEFTYQSNSAVQWGCWKTLSEQKMW